MYVKIIFFLSLLFSLPCYLSGQCQQPFGVSFTQKTKTTVDFRWTDPNTNPLGWDVEIIEKGTTPTGNPLNAVPLQTKMFQATQLKPSTFYEMYIRAVCSPTQKSNWNGPFIVSTVLQNPTFCQVNLDLKDNGTETFSIDIENQGILGQDVFISSVDLIAEHEWPADLRISLVNPSGKSVILANYHGTGGLHLGNVQDFLCFQTTSFSDQACEIFHQSKPPFNGNFLPHEKLASLHDFTQAKGIWRIVFHDRAAFHRGKLKYLNINLTRENCILPDNFNISEIKSNSLDVEWTHNPSCQSIKITIKEKGKPDDQEKVYFLNCLDGRFTIPGLLPETEYEIFYQSVCGINVSQPSCKELIRTNCKTATLSESFNNQTKCIESCQFPCLINGTWSNHPENSQNWIVWDDQTSTENTGPDGDISGEGNYIYLESQPDICSGQAAILQSNCLKVHSNADGCDFSFYYHMFGTGIGSLSLQFSKDQGETWETLWTKNGNQGNAWQRVILSLEDYDGMDGTFRFIANMQDNIYGDIAIDQIEFYGTTLNTHLSTYYRDADGDSFGDENNVLKLCQSFPPPGYVTQAGDCHDENDQIFPGQTEIRCNLIDENCNGMEDDVDPLFDLSWQATIQHETCRGEKNGKVQLQINGGTPPYQVKWNTGENTQDLINIENGIYFCTISDATGCALRSDFFVVESQQSIQYVVSGQVRPSCLGKSDGSILINHSGGVPPFTYLWSTGANQKDLQNVAEGTYTLTITDMNACQVVTSPILLPSLQGINSGILAIKHPGCFDKKDGSVTVGVVNGVPPYSYIWNNGASTAQINQIGSGMYSCTVSDSRGCLSFFSTQLTAPPKLESRLITVEPVRCHGEKNGIIKTTTNGGTPPYLFYWSHAAFEDDVFDLSAGYYTLTVTDKNGCVSILPDIEVKQPSPLISAVDTILPARCILGKNGAISLSSKGGTPPYHYAWNSFMFGDTSILEGLQTGIYSAVVFDNHGCKFNMGSINVPYLNIPLEVNGEILQLNSCFGDNKGIITAQVNDAKSPYDFNWSNGTQRILSHARDTIHSLSHGQYSVTITDQEGCIGTSGLLILPFIPELLYSVRQLKTNTCSYDSSGQIVILVSNARSYSTIVWNHGALGPVINHLPNGIYQAIIKDSAQCTLLTELLEIHSLSNLHVEPIVQHAGVGQSNGSICLKVTDTPVPHQIVWDHQITRVNGQCATDLKAGLYTVTVTDNLGCTVTDTIRVEESVKTRDEFADVQWLKPNPTNGIIYLTAGLLPDHIRIYDISGKLLITVLPENGIATLDLSDFPSGLYLAQIANKGRIKYEKIIKI